MKIIAIILLATILLASCCTKPVIPGESSLLWHDKERIQRYYPDGRDFKIENGRQKFNRALYGTNTAFRIEAGDLPEFAFYMPGMGGNYQLALARNNQTIWLNEARHITTRYRPGAMIYEITDPILGKGRLTLTAIAMKDEEGLILRADFTDTPENLQLISLYGGASDKKFSRSGDLNADPADSFFLKPENCKNNFYTLHPEKFSMIYGNKIDLTQEEIIQIQENLKNNLNDNPKGNYKIFIGTFPKDSRLSLRDATQIKSAGDLIVEGKAGIAPVIVATSPVSNITPLFISLHNPSKRIFIKPEEIPALYEEAEKKRQELADHLIINTPDSFLNTLGGVVSTVGDAIYEYPSYMHGAISWRMRLNGWRGAYVADVLGWHDRAESTFSSYALSQLTSPASAPVEMDTVLNQTRSREKLGNAMFSSGYICRNPNGDFRPHHYDMNLVLIDQFLNHFNWTGNIEYLRQMWPMLARHLAWEKRVFDPDGDGLYDAYACIWASDGLMYNGGGVTHSSAYNYKANKMAAILAPFIGKNPEPYRKEAEKILAAMNSKLWLCGKGQWAEFIDAMGLQQVHPSAGLWTVYHTADSDVPDTFQAYQALRYIDTEIPHIPFYAKGIENQGYYLLSTTKWMPYSWSVNNVAFAELMHTSLAYWQGDRAEEGFKLWKSAILDAMYCGLSPGNIGQISFYDAARGETYRDFADPTGMAARSIVEGLFGIQPDLMHNRVKIKPGYPTNWPHASIHLTYLDFTYKTTDSISSYTIIPRFQRPVNLDLEIPAKKDRIGKVTVNGENANYKINTNHIGFPTISIEIPVADKHEIKIIWAGTPVHTRTPEIVAAMNELCVIDFNTPVQELYDPQQLISEQEISDGHVQIRLQGEQGERTFFARLKRGDMSWWQPVHIHLGQAVEILPADNERGDYLRFYVQNNSARDLKGKLIINPSGKAHQQELKIASKSKSEIINIPAGYAQKGTNIVQVLFSGKNYEAPVVNWEIPMQESKRQLQTDIKANFNDKVNRIFRNRYLSPRPSTVTLQLPTQGIGEWCHPNLTVEINDSGLRSNARENIFHTPFGLSFYTPADSNQNNIAFVSLWDNYPDSITIPMAGKASHAYLLMAGTTNHMQSQFDNGVVTIHYKDGSNSKLLLRNPETWAPIERDYFTDGYAFAMKQARPYRVILKNGIVGRNLEHHISKKKLDERYLEGGGAIILDIPLDPGKEMDRLEVKALANDVIIGLMGITLIP